MSNPFEAKYYPKNTTEAATMFLTKFPGIGIVFPFIYAIATRDPNFFGIYGKARQWGYGALIGLINDGVAYQQTPPEAEQAEQGVPYFSES